MTPEDTSTAPSALTEEQVEAQLQQYLQERTKVKVTADQDLFRTGLVSSLFVTELVVHLEQTYGIALRGDDLDLDNYQSIQMMADLVLRLRNGHAA